MATAAVDRTLRVWDVRKLKGPLQQYELHAVASNLAFSQRGLLAVGMGNVVEVHVYCKKKHDTLLLLSYDVDLIVLQKVR
jgi:U3 small nucleolar RNA-associated protein 7